MLQDEEKWRQAEKKYDFNIIYLSLYNDRVNQFLHRRLRDQSWSLVYVDVYSVILLKNSENNSDIINEFRINAINIKERLKHLSESEEAESQIAAADIFIMLGQDDSALEIFNKVVSKWPERGRIWMVMGQLKSKKNDSQSSFLAVKYLEKAIESGQTTAETYSFLGLGYYRLGQFEKAKEVLFKAIEINPDRKDAAELLSIIEKSELQQK